MLKIQSNFSIPIIPHSQAYPKYYKMKEKIFKALFWTESRHKRKDHRDGFY